MLLETHPTLTRSHNTISVDFSRCKSLLHSFIPALTSNTHFKTKFSSFKGEKLSLKWKINSHRCAVCCLKAKLPSFLCVHSPNPLIELSGIKDNYFISIFPQTQNVQPILKSSAIETVTAVRSHRDKLVIVEQEEEGQQNTTDSARIILDKALLEDAAEEECREMMRRKKISQANKGKVPWNKGIKHKPETLAILRERQANNAKIPWNKGRKHSPETLALIRERTIQAMRDPKVRQKIVQNRDCQHSDATKARISASLRGVWDQRHKRKLLQQTCIREWEESIAETSRRGGNGDDELNWNSYELLKGKIEQEWLLARKMEKLENKRSYKRPSKTDNQKLKISQAIKAKWADPEYRERHRAGMYKFHGRNLARVRIPRRLDSKVNNANKPSKPRKPWVGQTSKPSKSLVGQTSVRSSESLRLPSIGMKKSHVYSDLLAQSQYQMENPIQTDQLTMEIKIRAAAERARLLIAETKKAAKLLEPAAEKDLAVRDSLYEAHRLLAEATESMRRVDSWRSSSVTTLARNDVTSTNARNFQSHDSMENSPFSASEPCGPSTENGNVKSRFEESQYAFDQTMPFMAKDIKPDEHLLCSKTPKPESESGWRLESNPEENIKSSGVSPINTISDYSSEAFNSSMFNEHKMEGTVGNLEARLEKIKKDDNFYEVKSVGPSLANEEERAFVQHDVLTSRKRTKRWYRGRLVDTKDD